jgi:hypothetical protein
VRLSGDRIQRDNDSSFFPYCITDEVVKTAAGNRWNGKEVMAVLLDRSGDKINITGEAIKVSLLSGNR